MRESLAADRHVDRERRPVYLDVGLVVAELEVAVVLAPQGAGEAVVKVDVKEIRHAL